MPTWSFLNDIIPAAPTGSSPSKDASSSASSAAAASSSAQSAGGGAVGAGRGDSSSSSSSAKSPSRASFGSFSSTMGGAFGSAMSSSSSAANLLRRGSAQFGSSGGLGGIVGGLVGGNSGSASAATTPGAGGPPSAVGIAPMQPPSASGDAPDMGHLTEEERLHIASVMQRAKSLQRVSGESSIVIKPMARDSPAFDAPGARGRNRSRCGRFHPDHVYGSYKVKASYGSWLSGVITYAVKASGYGNEIPEPLR